MVLGDCLDGKNNNVSFIKFIAAILVIFNHSFPLTGSGGDYISRWTNGQTTFGGVAVYIFFFYSGFLIMKSMENKKTAKDFFKARLNRLLPQLWMVVIASVFLLGPIMTTLSINEYFKNIDTYKYLINGLMIPIHELPGVFAGHKFDSTVNGSLWTLPVEFACYILCFAIYKLNLNRTKSISVIMAVSSIGYIVLYIVLFNIPMLRGTLIPCILYLMGMGCYLLRDNIRIKWYITVGLFAILIIGIYLNLFFAFAVITIPYILLHLGFATKIKLSRIGKVLDFSYGVYLVGWPVQQILCDLVPDITQFTNATIAIAISIVLGYLLGMFDKLIKKSMSSSSK